MSPDECSFRPMACELNYLSNSDGSAFLKQGETVILAGVNGPVQVKQTKSIYNKATVQAVYETKNEKRLAGDEGQLIRLCITKTCESALLTSLHPSTMIQISIEELEDNGSSLACILNSSCLALINSGLAMKYTFAAVCCMIDEESNNIILDPNTLQLKKAKAVFTLVFDSVKKELITCQSSGSFKEEELLTSIKKCREAVHHIFEFYRDIVKQYATAI
ncbi:hypothetical protein TKK_0006073 [Trichogramma kaykai]|uniref:Uncharacterized protein n=1 Tax=Trichogramma kaykai TaxID=54128 RepID=A0ABD2XEU1_9HYME